MTDRTTQLRSTDKELRGEFTPCQALSSSEKKSKKKKYIRQKPVIVQRNTSLKTTPSNASGRTMKSKDHDKKKVRRD